MSDYFTPDDPYAEAGKIMSKIKGRVETAMWLTAHTSYAAPEVFTRPSDLPGHSLLIATDARRKAAKVKVEVPDGIDTRALHILADGVGDTLGKIIRRMDKDTFSQRRIIQDGENFYFERKDGTCKGMSVEDGRRYKGSKRPFDLPDDDDGLKPGPWPTAYHHPDFCIPAAELEERKQKVRLTREAAAEEARVRKEQAEAEELRLALEKDAFYERAGYGVF